MASDIPRVNPGKLECTTGVGWNQKKEKAPPKCNGVSHLNQVLRVLLVGQVSSV